MTHHIALLDICTLVHQEVCAGEMPCRSSSAATGTRSEQKLRILSCVVLGNSLLLMHFRWRQELHRCLLPAGGVDLHSGLTHLEEHPESSHVRVMCLPSFLFPCGYTIMHVLLRAHRLILHLLYVLLHPVIVAVDTVSPDVGLLRDESATLQQFTRNFVILLHF